MLFTECELDAPFTLHLVVGAYNVTCILVCLFYLMISANYSTFKAGSNHQCCFMESFKVTGFLSAVRYINPWPDRRNTFRSAFAPSSDCTLIFFYCLFTPIRNCELCRKNYFFNPINLCLFDQELIRTEQIKYSLDFEECIKRGKKKKKHFTRINVTLFSQSS